MDLNTLADVWYQTDAPYFDEMMSLTDNSMLDMIWYQLSSAMDDGDMTDACDGVFTQNQLVFLYYKLRPAP